MKPLPNIIRDLFESGWCNPTFVPISGWICILIVGIGIWKMLAWLSTSR